MRRVTVEERRARLGRRHLLAEPAAHPREVANGVVALHATDPATVYLSCIARMAEPSLAMVHDAFATERCLVRMLGMRRTMFGVDVELMPVVEASSTRKVAAGERRKLVEGVEAAGLAADGHRWLDRVAAEVEGCLEDDGGLTAVELAERIPALRESIVMGAGTRNEVTQRVNSRVLFVMGAEGRILRGEPVGSWTAGRHRWVLPHRWLPQPSLSQPPPPPWETGPAQTELLRRWLERFGPGTEEDVRWWTGWTLGDVRRALAAVEAVEVELDHLDSGQGTGFLLPDDLDEVEPPDPWVGLLPALDPTPMGWKQRDWYLGPRAPELFDSTGNIGPTVWVDGRVVGAWAHRADGSIALAHLEPVDDRSAELISRASDRLADLVGDTIVIPRFKGPLDRRLARS